MRETDFIRQGPLKDCLTPHTLRERLSWWLDGVGSHTGDAHVVSNCMRPLGPEEPEKSSAFNYVVTRK